MNMTDAQFVKEVRELETIITKAELFYDEQHTAAKEAKARLEQAQSNLRQYVRDSKTGQIGLPLEGSKN